MQGYRNEAAFSRALCKVLTEHGYFVQRIETRGTGRGVPDLYVGTPDAEYWIELKCMHVPYTGAPVEIAWRPGQQAWALDRYKVTGRPCFTLVAFANCIAAIPMVRRFVHNTIFNKDVLTTWSRIGLVKL